MLQRQPNTKRWFYPSIFLVLTIFFLQANPAQTQITFERHYGGILDDVGQDVVNTPDGGYLQCGYTRSYGSGDYDLYLIHTDAMGDTLWTRSFGSTGYDAGFGITETASGDFIACGTYFDPVATIAKGYLIRIAANGELIWSVIHPDTTHTVYYDIREAHNGNYIITGTQEDTLGSGHLVILNIDDTGQILWSKLHPYLASSGGNAVLTTNDEGYLVCGYADNYNPTFNRNLYLLKTNNTGDTLWTHQYGGLAYEMGWDVCFHPSGGYLAVGYTTGMGASSGDAYLVKTDLDGHLEWFNHFGQSGLDILYGITTTSTDQIVATGVTAEQGSELHEAWLVGIMENGDTSWSHTFGGERRSYGYAVSETSDEGLILCGSTNATGNGVYDFYLVKTDANGSITTNLEQKTPQNLDFTIFPNPARDYINIHFSKHCGYLEVRDLMGNVVFSYQPEGISQLRISCEHWTRGIYTVKIQNKDASHAKILLIQ
jgi:hypothetical protein